MELLKSNTKIKFNEKDHTYFSKKGIQLTPVSNVISFFKPEFDPFGHIVKAVAKRDNLSTEQVYANWKRSKDEASIKGKNLHSQMEHYIKTGIIKDDDFKDVVEQFAKLKFNGKLYSEIIVADVENKICGTADLIVLNDDETCSIYDFKTNKKLDYKSRYGTKYIHPFSKYDECEFNNYTFQLNIYAFILKQNGYKTSDMTLLYLNPQTRILEHHPVPFIQEDAELMVKYYNSMQDW